MNEKSFLIGWPPGALWIQQSIGAEGELSTLWDESRAGAQAGPATGPPVTVTELPPWRWDLTPFALDDQRRVAASAVLATRSYQCRQARRYQDGRRVEVSTEVR